MQSLLQLHNRKPKVPRGGLLYISVALPFNVWCSDFCDYCRGDMPQSLALVAMGACIPGSHRTVTIRETIFGRLPPQVHCTVTETHISFVKEA